MLVTVAILGIIAKVVIPLLSSNDPQKLSVAAEETANTLRFALSEARRTGGYVLVDGLSTAGQLTLYYSDANANANVPPTFGTSAISDPLTQRAARLNVAGSPFSQGVSLTPQFWAGGFIRAQLLIGPGLTQFQGSDGNISTQGPLQANSGVLLSYGAQSVTVSINQITGLVTLP